MPPEKATASENTQSFIFSLEEVAGSVAGIDRALSIRQGLSKSGDTLLRHRLEELQGGLLELLKEMILAKEQTNFPSDMSPRWLEML